MAGKRKPSAQKRFWEALAARDASSLAACYADTATFKDPVFDLADGQVRDMWRMLFAGAADLRITVVERRETPTGFEGTWEANYTFSATGRPVRNRIRTTATVQDGLIVQQRDRFPFWRWARQALGLPGLLLGWTPFVARSVRGRALRSLRRFQQDAAPTEAERSSRSTGH